MAERRLAQLFYEIRAKTEGLSSDLTAAERQFGKLADFVKANPVAAIGALGVAMAGVALQATKMASEVETALRRVGNSIPNGIAGLDTLRAGIESVARDTGRAQADIARDLQKIAAQGVEGPAEAVERLKAVQLAADATGEDFQGIVEGLDQTLDLFGGSSEDAARALGTLFAAAKGKTSLTDLFAQLQAAAPAINKLKLDLDTAAKALVALGDQGLSAKQAATELNKLGEAGKAGRDEIVALANSIQPATDGLADLTRAANDFNNSAEQLNKRALNDFKSIMIDLGRVILPKATETLRDLLDIIELFTGAKAKRIKELGLSDLGAKFAEVTRANIDELKVQTGSFVKGAKDLAKIVADGQVGIVATTDDGIRAVAAGVQRLADLGILKAAEVKTTIDALNAAAAKGSGSPLVGGTGGPGADVLTDQLKAQKKAADEAQHAMEQLSKRVGDLGSVQEALSGRTNISAKQFAELAVEVQSAQEKFPQFRSVLDEFQKRIDSVRSATAQFHTAELAHEIDVLLASFTTTTVDDLTIALGELQKRLREKGATEEQIKQITELEEAFIAARKASEELDKSLEVGRSGALSPLREMVQLLDEQAEAERKLADLKGKGAEFDRTRTELLDQIAKLEARIKELQEQNAKHTETATTKTRDWLAGMEKVANVAFGVATALLGADDTLTRMIGSAAQVASGLSDIAKLAREAGGLGKLFSSGAGILSALPGIGSIIGGGAAIAALLGDSPAEKARAEATKEMRRAADALARAAGDLARISTSGSATAGVRRAVAGVRIPEFGSSNAENVAEDASVAAQLNQALKALGLSMQDFQQVAKDLGFDFSKGITAQGFREFQKALRELDFKAFADNFAGQLDALEQRFRLFDISEPSAQFDALIKLLTDPKVGAPALFGALEGLDTKTAEGREKAKKIIQDLFQQLLDGSIDPESLGGLNLDQFRQILDQLFGLLGDSVDTVTSLLEQLHKAFSEIDVDLEIAGITDPVTKAIRRAAAAIANDPRIASALGGLDLANEEQRRQAISALQKLAEGADDELKQIILELLRSIRDIPANAGGAGTPGQLEVTQNAARGLTETTGNRMADYLATANILQRNELDLLRAIRDKLNLIIINPSAPPTLLSAPSFSGSLGQPVTSATSVNFVVQSGAFQVNTPAITDAGVRAQVAGDLSTQFLRKVDEGLARLARQRFRANGDSVA